MLNQKENRIEVIVRKEGDTSSSGAKESDVESIGASGGDGGVVEPSTSSSSSSRRLKRIIKTNATHTFAVMKQIYGLGVEYRHAGLALQNGDQALQDQVSRKFEIIEDTTNLTTSVFQGATYGSWGGPAGTLIGMALGFLSTKASISVKYKGRERDFNYKIFKENNAIEYKRARAGINLTTGRLR